MRKSLLMTAAVLSLASGAAFAQSAVGSTQSPPSPNAASQPPQPANSVPPGAATSAGIRPGSNLGATAVSPPATQPRVMATPAVRARPVAKARASAMSEPMAGPSDVNAPPTSAYRGGASVPMSARASNTTSANTRTEIAPRFPEPTTAGNTSQDYMMAAQRALARGQTGAAQEALERAETRLVTRSTAPGMANQPDEAATVQRIGEARRALATNNIAAARAALAQVDPNTAGPSGPRMQAPMGTPAGVPGTPTRP